MNAPKVMIQLRRLAVGLAACSLTGSVALATPYASSVVSNAANSQVTFVLNQDAQGLVVLRDGANPVYPGTTAGTHSFDMTGYASYQIIVTGNTAKAWTQFIPDGQDRNFWFPNSVAINKNPASTNFGKVYVGNNWNGTGLTGGGRSTPDGIYVLRADGVAISGPHTGGVDWTTDAANYSRPYKINLNPDDNCLYVSSYFDDTAYGFNEDLSVATQLLDDSNKTEGQYVESVYATGKRSDGTLSLFAVNSHYLDPRVGLINYNIGANAAALPGDTGSQVIGPSFYSYYPGDVDRDSSGNWYMTQYRATAGQAAAVNKFDGSLAWPINTSVWDSSRDYTYIRGAGVNEAGGTVAVCRYATTSGLVYFFDLETGAYKETVDIGNYSRDIAFDIAGNMVSVDNSTEYARFWSPGGYSVATTRSDGTFDLYLPDNLSVNSTVDAMASEDGPDTAKFTITRSGGPNADLQVYFALTGTAVSNVDYTISPTSPFTFPAGQSSIDITVTPINDAEREPTETVVLTLAPTPDYYVTSDAAATVMITDNDLVVRYWDANGSEFGAGADATGTWGNNNFWSTSPDGTVATGAWQDWGLAVFSAGADWGFFTVTVNGTQKVDGPSFEDSTVTLSGGTLLLTNFSGIAVATGAQATINSTLAGVSGMTKDGPGTLLLGGANNYTGATVINDGILQLSVSDVIPDLSGVNIGATGTLETYGNNDTIGSLAGATGAILNMWGGTLTFGGDNTDSIWNGTARSGSTLVKVGTGTTSMQAGEIGDTLTILGGVFSINAATRLGSANEITINNGATLQSTSAGVGSDFISPGRTVTVAAGGGTLKVTDVGAILMVRDTSVISGPGTLTKDGPGEIRTYSVEHSFSKLIVSGGMYTAGHSTSLGYNTSFGAIPATLTPDAIMIQNGASIRKAGGQSVALDPKQGITLGTGGGMIRSYAGNTDAGTFEIPSPISGSGPLVLGSTSDVGAIFVLSGNNTYSGGTTINAGTTEVRKDGGLGSGNVTVGNGAILRLTSGTANTYINSAATLSLNGAAPSVDLAFTGAPNAISALYIGGIRMAAGTWGAVGSGATHEHAFFTGTGMLSVLGSSEPLPVTEMTIGPVSAGNCTINYSGGTGSQFVLLGSPDVAAPLSTWARVATNTATAGSFTIPIGTDPRSFYRIESE